MRFPAALLLPLALAAQAPPAPDNLCAISGQVVNAATAEPVRRALVYLRRIDSSAAANNIRTTNAVSTDGAGRFAVSGIEPGTYHLSAERSGFLVTAYGARGPGKAGTPLILERGQKSSDLLFRLTPHSVITGRVLDEDGEPMTGIDVQVSRLQYMRGRKHAPLEIVLSPNAGQVTGTVLDSKTQKPVSAMTVVLVPQEKDRRDRETFYKAGTTDQAGHFTFKNVVPGDYKVFSWEEVSYGAWMDPDFMAPHESRGEAVTIREGSPQSIQVNLIADQ